MSALELADQHRAGEMKVNFLGIGAQKCASTWLYDILSDHPDVSLSSEKEIDFFSYYYDYGFQWYERHFEPKADGHVTGEVSPSYFHVAGVPERVYAYDPSMRLMLFLREPVQRALSNHKHEVRIGHLTGSDLSFESGLKNNPLYVEQGLYATHLEQWLKLFPRDQILIILFDDVVANGREVAKKIFEFLEISSAHRPAALEERSNESYVNRFGVLESTKNSIRGMIRSLRLGWIWEVLGNYGLRRLYRTVNRMPSDAIIPPMKAETRDSLANHFADEIDRLEALTGIDLEAWRRQPSED